MKTLKLSTQYPFNASGPIQVICTGADNNERQLPKFNGRSGNPNEYLRKLKRYYEKSLERQPHVDPAEHLRDVLEMSFEGPASRWLQLIKTDLNDWECFAAEFTNKYWSREVQRGIRNKIEAERYRSNGTLSRTEYFTERVLLLQSITPTMTEEEIVILLAERFDQIIQDSRNVQNITTVKAFERLLQKEDIRDGPRRVKQNNSPPHNINPRPSNTNHSSSPPIDNRAYQPKNHYPGQQQYRSNGPDNRQNNYTNRYSQNNYRHRDYKPYQREPYPPRHQSSPPHRNDRPYPTSEQAQVCSMIRQSSSSTHSTSPTRSNNHSPPSSPSQEN